jgi:hypothetical protein
MGTIMPRPPLRPPRRRALLGQLAARHGGGLLVAEVDADDADVLAALGNLDLFEEVDSAARSCVSSAVIEPALLFEDAAASICGRQGQPSLDRAACASSYQAGRGEEIERRAGASRSRGRRE